MVAIGHFVPPNLKREFYHGVGGHKGTRHNGLDPYGFSTEGLVLYLPLPILKNSSFKSVDAYKPTATVTGALWGPTGRTFDGTDDVITIPDAASISALSPISVEVWFLSDGTPAGEEGIISKAGADVADREWNLLMDTSGRIGFVQWGGVTNYLLAVGTNDFSGSGWHHALVSWDGVNATGHIVITIDGAVEALTTDSKVAGGGVAQDTGTDIEVGREYVNNDNCFTGKIGEAWVYNRTLPTGEANHNDDCTRWRYQ